LPAFKKVNRKAAQERHYRCGFGHVMSGTQTAYLVFTMNRQSYTLVAAAMAALVSASTDMSRPAMAQGIAEAGSMYGASSMLSPGRGLSAALGSAYNPSRNSRSSTSGSRQNRSAVYLDEADAERYKAAGERSVQLWNKAKDCEKKGELENALRLYRETLSIRWQIWRDRDPAVPQLLTAIGSLEEKTGKLQDAEKCYRDWLSLTAKNYGPGSWELCTPLAKLANVLSQQKKYHEAASNYNLVFELTKRKYGMTDARTEAAAVRLADATKYEHKL
jgi:tetratricopeptide (TPR) repeat protein